jgi:hypothetical protein
VRAVVLSLAAVLGVSACTTVDNGPPLDPPPALDEARFRCAVEPILARDCSFMACHGLADSPLRVYSVGKLRAGAAATLDERQVELTTAERHANFVSAAAFAYAIESPDDSLLLRKVLPVSDGGSAHKGGAIFGGPGDARTVAVRAWLAGGTGCGGGTP